MSTLFVGGLSMATEELDIAKLIMPFGQISTIKIVCDKFSGKPKGFAFVEMLDSEDAAEAASQLNGTILHERELTINIQVEKPQSNSRPNFQPKDFSQSNYVKINRGTEAEKKKRPRRQA